jgi:hypothetical protein
MNFNNHVQRGVTTHIRVTPIKMAWLILGIERCDGIRRIDVATDVHMKVSHAKWFDPTVEIHAMYTGTTEKC